ELTATRWFRDGKRVVAVGRAPSDEEYRLFILLQDGSAPSRVSDIPLTARRTLQLSPDNRWAAALDKNDVLILLSTGDGRVARLPEAGADAIPRGWSSEGHLWVTRGGDRTPARARLLRFDVEHHRLLEERTVGPAEVSGAIWLRDVVISPDGRSVA